MLDTFEAFTLRRSGASMTLTLLDAEGRTSKITSVTEFSSDTNGRLCAFDANGETRAVVTLRTHST